MSRRTHYLPLLVAAACFAMARPGNGQKPLGLVVTTSGESTSVATPELLVRVPEPATAGTLERVTKRIVLRLSGRFVGSTELWHQQIELKLADIQFLRLTGDWCASPPSGGVEIRLRNGNRHVLAAAGPTRYQEIQAKPRRGVFDKDMPIQAWELRGEVAKNSSGENVPTVVVRVVGKTPAGPDHSVPWCELGSVTFP